MPNDPYLAPLPDENREALKDPRVKSFLDRIGKSEGADYNTLVGGSRIEDLSRHPNKVGLRTSAGPSTAFGKYQIVHSTERSKLRKYNNLDYSPENQDVRAVELLRQTGALKALQSDNEDEAVRLAGREWASLPGSPLPGRKSSVFSAQQSQQDPYLQPLKQQSDPYLVELPAATPSPTPIPSASPQPAVRRKPRAIPKQVTSLADLRRLDEQRVPVVRAQQEQQRQQRAQEPPFSELLAQPGVPGFASVMAEVKAKSETPRGQLRSHLREQIKAERAPIRAFNQIPGYSGQGLTTYAAEVLGARSLSQLGAKVLDNPFGAIADIGSISEDRSVEYEVDRREKQIEEDTKEALRLLTDDRGKYKQDVLDKYENLVNFVGKDPNNWWRSADVGLIESGASVMRSLAGIAQLMSYWGPDKSKADELRRTALIAERAMQQIREDVPLSKKEEAAAFVTRTIGDLAQLELFTAAGGPIAGFAAHGGIQSIGRNEPLSSVLAETTKGAALGTVFKAAPLARSPEAGALRNFGRESALIGAGTVGVETAAGSDPLTALTSAGTNIAFHGVGQIPRVASAVRRRFRARGQEPPPPVPTTEPVPESPPIAAPAAPEVVESLPADVLAEAAQGLRTRAAAVQQQHPNRRKHRQRNVVTGKRGQFMKGKPPEPATEPVTDTVTEPPQPQAGEVIIRQQAPDLFLVEQQTASGYVRTQVRSRAAAEFLADRMRRQAAEPETGAVNLVTGKPVKTKKLKDSGFVNVTEIQDAIDSLMRERPELTEDQARTILEARRPYLFRPGVTRAEERDLEFRDSVQRDREMDLADPDLMVRELEFRARNLRRDYPDMGFEEAERIVLSKDPQLARRLKGDYGVQDIDQLRARRPDATTGPAEQFAQQSIREQFPEEEVTGSPSRRQDELAYQQRIGAAEKRMGWDNRPVQDLTEREIDAGPRAFNQELLEMQRALRDQRFEDDLDSITRYTQGLRRVKVGDKEFAVEPNVLSIGENADGTFSIKRWGKTGPAEVIEGPFKTFDEAVTRHTELNRLKDAQRPRRLEDIKKSGEEGAVNLSEIIKGIDDLRKKFPGESPARRFIRLQRERPELFYERAQHASAKAFNTFNDRMNRTGQGANTYGHGFYFSEHPETHKSYLQTFGRNSARYEVGGEKYDPASWVKAPDTATHTLKWSIKYLLDKVDAGDPLGAAAEQKRVEQVIADKSSASGEFQELANYYNKHLAGKSWEQMRAAVKTVGGANSYEVSINLKPDEVLLWDKPLTEQPAAVRQKLNKVVDEFFKGKVGPGEWDSEFSGTPVKERSDTWSGVINANLNRGSRMFGYAKRGSTGIRGAYYTWNGGHQALGPFSSWTEAHQAIERAAKADPSSIYSQELAYFRDVRKDFSRLDDSERTGQYMYETLASVFGEKETSEGLANIGIKGHKYRDAGSRKNRWARNMGADVEVRDEFPTYNFVVYKGRDATVRTRNGEQINLGLLERPAGPTRGEEGYLNVGDIADAVRKLRAQFPDKTDAELRAMAIQQRERLQPSETEARRVGQRVMQSFNRYENLQAVKGAQNVPDTVQSAKSEIREVSQYINRDYRQLERHAARRTGLDKVSDDTARNYFTSLGRFTKVHDPASTPLVLRAEAEYAQGNFSEATRLSEQALSGSHEFASRMSGALMSRTETQDWHDVITEVRRRAQELGLRDVVGEFIRNEEGSFKFSGQKRRFRPPDFRRAAKGGGPQTKDLEYVVEPLVEKFWVEANKLAAAGKLKARDLNTFVREQFSALLDREFKDWHISNRMGALAVANRRLSQISGAGTQTEARAAKKGVEMPPPAPTAAPKFSRGQQPNKLWETLAKAGREAGTEQSHTPEKMDEWKAQADKLIRDFGVQGAQKFYDDARPSAVRTAVGQALGDYYQIQAARTNDPVMLAKSVALANERVTGAVEAGRTVKAYDLNNRFSLSGALDEATKLYRQAVNNPTAELPVNIAQEVNKRAVRRHKAVEKVTELEKKVEAEPELPPEARKPRLVKKDKGEQGSFNLSSFFRDETGGGPNPLASNPEVVAAKERLKEARQKLNAANRRKKNPLPPEDYKALHDEMRAAYRSLQDIYKGLRETGESGDVLEAASRARRNEAARNFRMMERRLGGHWTKASHPALEEARIELRDATYDLAILYRALQQRASPARRLFNLQRALMVSAFPTAARNTQTQVSRSALERLTDAVEVTIRRALGMETEFDYKDIARNLGRLRSFDSWRFAEQVLKEHPDEFFRMYASFAGDVQIPAPTPFARGVDRIFGNMERAAYHANFFNRVQEFHIRSAEFLAELELHTKKETGISLEEFVARRGADKLPAKLIEAAVDKALDVTFANNPPTNTEVGKALNGLIRFGNALPPTMSPAAFPRFMYNNLKFLYQYNPIGGAIEIARTARKGGNIPRAVGRWAIGTSMFLLAYQIRRDKDLAGERWYELKTPLGTMDTRPFGPFSTYLFLGEMARRWWNGERPMSFKEVAEALGASTAPGGLSIATIERLYDYYERGDFKKMSDLLAREAGDMARAMLTPIRQFKDVISQFNAEERITRDTRESPFLGPIRESIPFASRGLPPAYRATSGRPIQQEAPLQKTVTGYREVSPKSYIEHELDRLHFRPNEIRSYTGNAKLDNRINQRMGEMLDQRAVELQSDPRYQKASDKMKFGLLKAELQRAYKHALGEAAREFPNEYREHKMKQIPAWKRALIEERRQLRQ